MKLRPWTLAILGARSAVADFRARSMELVGRHFGTFGRSVGLRLLVRGQGGALSAILAPVSLVRYFEFAFAEDAFLGCPSGECLDVSSPRLFSLYARERLKCRQIDMINPDVSDAAATEEIVKALNVAGISVRVAGVSELKDVRERFDRIWSLSVLEHISGASGDSDAIHWMFRALRPGGRLVVTVPVDRVFREERRRGDPYGLSTSASEDAFFQRWYDEDALRQRICIPVGAEPSLIRWFGEVVAGRFAQYETSWAEEGIARAVGDPVEVARHYSEFPSWRAMPGAGVCGLMFVKGR